MSNKILDDMRDVMRRRHSFDSHGAKLLRMGEALYPLFQHEVAR
jgi:hypothetical protein